MPEGNPPISESDTLRSAARLVPALLAVLLAGAAFYFKERMLFIDAPHVLFRIINDGHLWIEEHRYGSFISQLLPFIGAKLHLPIYWELLLYSVGFYLFYLSIAALIVYRYSNYGLGLLLGVYFTLFVSDSFYWSNNEVHQGMGWLLLAFAANAYIAQQKRPMANAIVFFLISFFLAIWTHPLVMLVAIFLWVFYWLRKTDWPYNKQQSIIYTGILVLLCLLKYAQSMSGGYDGTKMEVVRQFHLADIRAVFSSPMLHYFLKSCLYNYWLFVAVFVAGLAGLVKEKKYLLLLWTICFSGGYLLIVCITFRDLATNRFYIESEYMALSVICAAPFIYYVLPRLHVKTGVALMACIFVVRLGYVYSAVPQFTARITILNSINERMKTKQLTKVAITDIPATVDSALIMNWAAPVESMLLSGLKGESPQRTFLFADADLAKMAGTTGRDTMIGCWEKRPVSRLNSVYFRLDTTGPYRVMSYHSLME